MKLIIVSGLSGSGKTVALHTLEDEDYYCIDNLHLGLLPEFVRQLMTPGQKLYENVAVGIDARSGAQDLRQFPDTIDKIRATGLDVEIVFLQAQHETLIKRFSETRRKHPLARHGIPLLEAIQLEEALLADIASQADLSIDTTKTNVHQLCALVRNRICGKQQASLSLLFQSFGFKHGAPSDSDYVFDVRCLPNPHWEPRLRSLTGQDPEVIEFLEKHAVVEDMFGTIREFLVRWVPQFAAENRNYLSISIGCTGGQHRSVYLAERLTQFFRERDDYSVSTRHRELG